MIGFYLNFELLQQKYHVLTSNDPHRHIIDQCVNKCCLTIEIYLDSQTFHIVELILAGESKAN